VSTGFCLEQITCLAYAAAVTQRIRLLTSVMVAPHRPPILAAKMLTTADVLSKGRVTVGFGVGWMAEEMAALGSPPYDKRGTASNEYIEAFRALWTQAAPSYQGEFIAFRDVLFEPKPVQRPHLPIWVGGEGTAARRRAGRLGDGWYPTIRNPKEPLDTPAAFAAALADVHRHAQAAGRDPMALDIALFAPGYSLGAPQKGSGGQRIAFTGSAQQIAQDIRAYEAVGVRHIVIGLESSNLQDHLDRVEGYAKEVVPLVA
jgi:probable F420-dependent oxidoreductase